MTKEQLLEELTACAAMSDKEAAHSAADFALLRFINDPDISKAFTDLKLWYA